MKEPSDLSQYQEGESIYTDDVSLEDLLEAFQNFLKKKELEKPLNTKITKKEYSVSIRSNEIKSLLKRSEERRVGKEC